jgi:hypothetical protein
MGQSSGRLFRFSIGDSTKAFEMLLNLPLRMKRRHREKVARKGDRVRFQIAHVFLPDAREVLASLTETTELEGTITDFSDSGNALQAFAVVQLDEKRRVVVPVDRLRAVIRCNSETKNEHRGGST